MTDQTAPENPPLSRKQQIQKVIASLGGNAEEGVRLTRAMKTAVQKIKEPQQDPTKNDETGITTP